MKNVIIFLLLQVFFVVFGIALFFSLKALKESQVEKAAISKLECDFPEWIGKPVDEQDLKGIARPYRVLPPGSLYSEERDPKRISINTDDKAVILSVSCG